MYRLRGARRPARSSEGGTPPRRFGRRPSAHLRGLAFLHSNLHRFALRCKHARPRMPLMRTRELVIPGVIEAAGLQVEERELDALRPAEALIAMEAAGVSYAEVAMLRGLYPGQPAFPFVPG